MLKANKYLNHTTPTLDHKQSTNVEDIGVEPMTSCVQGRRSSQLS